MYNRGMTAGLRVALLLAAPLLLAGGAKGYDGPPQTGGAHSLPLPLNSRINLDSGWRIQSSAQVA
jgi:hypothetical protein